MNTIINVKINYFFVYIFYNSYDIKKILASLQLNMGSSF